jgi:hypothetical protein
MYAKNMKIINKIKLNKRKKNACDHLGAVVLTKSIANNEPPSIMKYAQEKII